MRSIFYITFMKARQHSTKKQRSLVDRKPSDIVVKTQLENSFDTRWAEIKIQGKNIPSRSNHASVVFQNNLFVHGGFDADKGMLADFNCIDISEQVQQYRWVKLNNQCEGQQIKLKSHSAIVYESTIYLFGGEKSPINSSNLIFAYDIKKDQWTKIKPNIDIPKVDSHSAVLFDKKMYVYGGYIPQKATYLSDIYAFDIESKKWQLFYKSQKGTSEPECRSDFDMVVHEGDIWLFGGSNGKQTLNDFWKFNLKEKKWELIVTKQSPEGRRGHSMLSYKQYIFMFGGIQDVTKEKNDVYIYESKRGNWSKIHTTTNSIYDCSPTLKKSKKESSPPKITIMKVESEDNKDVDPMQKILQQNRQKKFNERKKQLLKQFQEQPTHKSKRSLSPTTESMLKTLETIGIQEQNKTDVHQQIIYDQTHRFIIGKKPCARDGQSVTIFKNKMFIFGGDRHLMAFNDLYFFDLQKGIKSLLLYHDK